MSERLMTTSEVAAYLRVSQSTLAEWRYKGTGPRGHRVGRYVRYSKEDVEAWLESRRDGAESAPGSAA